MILGLSLAGKTTLVLALVQAGARYYSDEFAVVDERGLVRPFATPPAPRDLGGRGGERDVVRFDEAVGAPPLPIGAVVLTTYRPGAQWEPARLSPGRGALAMLANTVAALKRSEEALGTITRALNGAVVLEGERGEADEIVPQLLGPELGASWARSGVD